MNKAKRKIMNSKGKTFSITFVVILVSLACSLVTGITEEIEPTQTLAATRNVETQAIITDTAEPTGTLPTQPADPPVKPEFAVILVTEGDVLNVRSGAGVNNNIIATLDPHATGVLMTGNRQKVADSMWVEVETPGQVTGWVNAHFLTVRVGNQTFCNDPGITRLLGSFVNAVNTRDGAALAPLVSPTHGLTVRLNWWNPAVNFRTQNQIASIFNDPTSHDWGIQDGSGMAIQGAFKDEILPWLDDVFSANFSQHCNDLENGSGSSAGFKNWPFEYQNINYVALYRAAQPGDELNWRTWVVGITYHQGQPYIAILVQYHWEI